MPVRSLQVTLTSCDTNANYIIQHQQVTVDNYVYTVCSYIERIRVPFTPEILKSSNNRTVFSRKGSATSESRTYSKFSYDVTTEWSMQNATIIINRILCLISFFIIYNEVHIKILIK